MTMAVPQGTIGSNWQYTVTGALVKTTVPSFEPAPDAHWDGHL
jgi:hypothetical protein